MNLSPAIAVNIIVSTGAASNIPSYNSDAAFIASHRASINFPSISKKSISSKNVPICVPILYQSICSNAVVIVVRMPFAQTFIVSAKRAKSNVLKNSFIPVAIERPKSVQSNSFPKEFRNQSAVFKAPAIVRPNAPNSSGEMSPFKNCANPVPKFLADSYTLSQSMLFIASVRTFPIYSPNS